MMRCVGVGWILGFVCAGLYSVSAQKTYLPFSPIRFSPETPEPINIVSSNVKKIVTAPLIFSIDFTDRVLLINTGCSVEMVLTSPTTSTFAFSGVLGKDFYIVSRAKYIFSNETGGIAGNTVDGKQGERLEVRVYFYNLKYHSFENALNHRDGIFEICSRIIVGGNIPNLLFSPFVPYLKKVRHPGNSLKMSVDPAMMFYLHIPRNIQYYAYPGSYTNETSGKQYYSTTTIVLQVLPDRYITKQQYEDTFGSILNSRGKRLNTASPTLPAGDRPIVSTRGIIEIPSILSVFPVKPGGI